MVLSLATKQIKRARKYTVFNNSMREKHTWHSLETRRPKIGKERHQVVPDPFQQGIDYLVPTTGKKFAEHVVGYAKGHDVVQELGMDIHPAL